MTAEARSLLRSIPSLTGTAPALDADDLPGEPVALFRAWLAVALEHDVAEPHAMTLAARRFAR